MNIIKTDCKDYALPFEQQKYRLVFFRLLI